MNQILSLFFTFCIAQGFFISQNNNHSPQTLQSSAKSNLQFSNLVGPGCTLEEEHEFADYVNDASAFYREDYEKCLNYSSVFMENKFSKRYSVIVQTTAGAIYDGTVWSQEMDFLSMGEKCDNLFPQRSYLMIANSNEATQAARFYISKAGEQGSGITALLKEVIQNVIKSTQTDSSCTCKGAAEEISNKLMRFDGGKWSVICSSKEDLFGQVWVKNRTYYYAHPNTCFYFVWKVIE